MPFVKKWVEVKVNDSRLLCDVEFLLSGYECTFGKGCPGVLGNSDVGCCYLGTTIYDKELDEVTRRVSMLTPSDWQFHGAKWSRKNKTGHKSEKRQTTTVVHNGVEGCVFANRHDFEGGAGCAFHRAALVRGENPIDWKPEICWTVPIQLDYIAENNLAVLRQVGHWDWSGVDEQELSVLNWWCTDDNSAWQSSTPVFVSLAQELERTLTNYFEDHEVWPAVRSMLEELWESAPSIEPVAVPVSVMQK